MTFLKTLRETAMYCRKAEVAAYLRECADDLEEAINGFAAYPSEDTLKYVNGLWVRAKRAYDATPPMTEPDSPLGGSVEPARLAA